MNCTTVEKLLPLYVEGDVAVPLMTKVRAHLSSCGHCRSLEEEFRASQSRLHNLAVPEFGADFYEQIRGAVLTEINSSPLARPSVFHTLRTLFMWRPALAFSFALLVLFGALSFGLYRSLIKPDAPLLVIEQSMGEFNPVEMAEAAVQNVKDDSIKESGGVRQQDITERNNILQQKSQISGQRIVRPESSIPLSIVAHVSSVAENTQANGRTVEASATQAVARMDIQTSDPNIRIIWLGRKPSEQ
ncbi:MAG TPA: zf-HC2 domain-containing protein [Pyrinomonadaceae bacterium]|jgi:hypothetical protein